MANQGHLDLLRQGVKVWNQWIKQHSRVRPNFSGADFSGADLSGVNLIYADLNEVILVGTNLSKANLQFANLSDGDLSDASFYGADLSDAILHRTNLTKTDFRSTHLFFADFSDAAFHMTNLSYASLWATSFGDVDLRQVDGLETLRHRGRSYVDIHTLYRSQGHLPETFLRGIGASDEAIAYTHTFFLHPIQYHSCFISYSSKDEILARNLHTDLQNQGVRCWFAPEDMKIGDKIRSRIDEAVHIHDKLLLLLSEHSITSLWVEDEVEAALEKEQRQQHEVLFPIRLDESVMQTTQAWAASLRRTRHIGDFTRWRDPQAYQQSFERLLRDLKAKSDTKGEMDGKLGTS